MKACPICRSSTRLRHQVSSPYVDASEPYEIRRCNNCGHLAAFGRTDSEFLAKVYSQDFHATSQQDAPIGPAGELPEEIAAFPILANARQRVDVLRRKGLHGRLLDIGSGKGFFLLVARGYFEVMGVELSEDAARLARNAGLRVQSGDFLQVDVSGRFDVVTLWDVLAGFVDPLAALRRVRSLLDDSGCCVLTVPMGDSRAASWLGRFWPFWIPPVNLHYFSRRSLQIACQREGLEIESIAFPGKRVAISFAWLKLLRVLGLGKVEWLRNLVSTTRSIPLNFHDIATVVLRPAGKI